MTGLEIKAFEPKCPHRNPSSVFSLVRRTTADHGLPDCMMSKAADMPCCAWRDLYTGFRLPPKFERSIRLILEQITQPIVNDGNRDLVNRTVALLVGKMFPKDFNEAIEEGVWVKTFHALCPNPHCFLSEKIEGTLSIIVPESGRPAEWPLHVLGIGECSICGGRFLVKMPELLQIPLEVYLGTEAFPGGFIGTEEFSPEITTRVNDGERDLNLLFHLPWKLGDALCNY